jgi:hypothetical protein
VPVSSTSARPKGSIATAEFHTIVTDGISDKLLQWKGIEATQDLAKSQNAKIVIIGNSKNGLPLVLGDVK